MKTKPKIILAVTGASGALYARRTFEALLAADVHIYLIISPTGKRLLQEELSSDTVWDSSSPPPKDQVTLLAYQDVGACAASGSFQHDGMIVVPCSSNKLAEIAHGLGNNLIARAAQVTLKERRKLILVHREMPLGLIELRNMTAVTEAGGILCPATPGFYTHPQTVDDLVNMVVGRVLDLADIPHTLHRRWRENN